MYSENNKRFNKYVSSGHTKASKHKIDCVFYQPLSTTNIETNWTFIFRYH